MIYRIGERVQAKYDPSFFGTIMVTFQTLKDKQLRYVVENDIGIYDIFRQDELVGTRKEDE